MLYCCHDLGLRTRNQVITYNNWSTPPKVLRTTPLPAGCTSQVKRRQVEMGIKRHSNVMETTPEI